jgi:acyl carrier protein
MNHEIDNHKISELINLSINQLNDQGGGNYLIGTSPEDDLFGGNSPLDSLGLVSFLVILEQNIQDTFEKSITIADEKALSFKNSPFKKIGTLADYISTLLK